MLAASSYVTSFPADSALSERVIFPAGPHETHGMEDARFVRFTDDDGEVTYYATYTAFDGFEIMPQLIETDDFASFRISTLNGPAAQNKGMALFPRRIHGNYVMLSRRDRENLHLATSTDVRHWADVTELHRPSRSWELLQIGNCGSPLETDEGWLVVTHGVGPMRRYVLGAILLDLDDPRRVVGQLREPLLSPEARSARATSRTSSTRAARCSTGAISFCRTGCPTAPWGSPWSRSLTCWRRCGPVAEPQTEAPLEMLVPRPNNRFTAAQVRLRVAEDQSSSLRAQWNSRARIAKPSGITTRLGPGTGTTRRATPNMRTVNPTTAMPTLRTLETVTTRSSMTASQLSH